MSLLFDLRGVSVRYDEDHALDDVTVQIRRGEKVALVGRSGAGKSTLLRLLYERAGAEAAMVPQSFGLVRNLSVFHNVYMARLRRHGALYNLVNLIKPLRAEVDAVLPVVRRLGMTEKLFDPAGQLSGGQQQRTAVARAMHQGSDVIMADEPVSSVDEHQSRRVMEAIVSDHETVIMAMHDTGLAIDFSDRVIGLRGGRVVLDQPTDGMRPADLHGLYAG